MNLYSLKHAQLSIADYKNYPLSMEISSIFSVPKKNSIGTLSIGNALTLLHFGKNKVNLEVVAADFFRQVDGGELSFLPVFSDKLIGYAQTKSFVLFDFGKKQANLYLIGKEMYDYVTNVQVVNSEKNQFIFEIERSIGQGDPDKILKIIDFSSDYKDSYQYTIINKKTIGKYDKWLVADKSIFTYDENKIKVYDFNFKAIDHPLLKFIEKKDIKLDLVQLYIHPSLPFGIFVEFNDDVSVFSWCNIDKPEIKPLFKGNMTGPYNFSPDGKYIVFQGITDSSNLDGPEDFFLMKIDQESDVFLSPPVKLGRVQDPSLTAWTSDPFGFAVLEDNKNIIKWDLSQFQKTKND